MTRKLASIIALAAGLAAPASAQADATLTASLGGPAVLRGDDGDNTLVAVNFAGFGVFFGDANGPTQGPTPVISGCADSSTVPGAPVPFPGILCTSVSDVTINGGLGNDTLLANPGTAATLDGQADDDTLVGGPEDDSFTGGGGSDTVAYATVDDAMIATRATGVTATLAEPGATTTVTSGGETDTLEDNFETFAGSNAGDTITGSSEADTIAGAVPPGLSDLIDTSTAGNDVITGGAGDDTLLGGDTGSVTGGAGDDTVVGGRLTTGTTVVTGGDGDDTLLSGLGKDDLTGGPGADVLAYASASIAGLNRPGGVTARLPEPGGPATTGNGTTGGAENDVIRDNMETLVGGNGSDILRGNNGFNTIVGVAPAGTAGVTPGPAGNDILEGMGGPDILFGAEGNDTLLAKDGARDPVLICGAGTDSVTGDAVDTVGADCENVTGATRAVKTPVTPVTSVTSEPLLIQKDKTKPKVSVKPHRLKLRKHRRVRLFVRCRNEKQGCKGTIRLRLGKKTVAKKKFSAKGKKRKRVTLRLSRKAVRRVRARKRTRVKVVVRARDTAGNRRKKTIKATLKR